jgi:hypothetical protein
MFLASRHVTLRSSKFSAPSLSGLGSQKPSLTTTIRQGTINCACFTILGMETTSISVFHCYTDLSKYSVPAQALKNGELARIGAHSDFGSLTMLFQDDVGGLEIEDPNSPGEFKAGFY